MKNVYISISITYFDTKAIAPQVHYYRNDYEHNPISQFNKLSVDEANRMMWELVRIGGKNSYVSNWFNNGISTRQVSFYGRP